MVSRDCDGIDGKGLTLDILSARWILAACVSAVQFQSYAVAAEPNVNFICTAERAAYHVYIREHQKWELGVDTADTAFLIQNLGKGTNSAWNVKRLIDADDETLSVEDYGCGRDFSGSYLVCKTNREFESTVFRFNVITLKFDVTQYSSDWLSDRVGVALVYKFGGCKKRESAKKD